MTASKSTRKKSIPTPDVGSIPEPAARPVSKQAQVVALLRRAEGASAQEIMEATGWQKHSVRGFISGTAKKGLGLVITTEKGVQGTVYKVSV